MFITPNSTVQLFEGVSLESGYRNTFYFATRAAQNDYFINHLQPWTLNRYTFIREERAISVALDSTITYQVVSQCNYLRFKNTAFFDKWFYAFIDRVEYVNNGNAKVYFTIDVMQTWLPNIDYDFEECMILREHPRTDAIGDNLIPENLPTGDYLYADQGNPYRYNPDTSQDEDIDFSECIIIVALAEYVTMVVHPDGQIDITYLGNKASYWGKNNVSGLFFMQFQNTQTGIQQFNALIEDLSRQGKADEVYAIFWIPKILWGGWNVSVPAVYGEDWSDQFNRKVEIPFYVKSYFGFNGTSSGNTANIDGYVPKNNKLFTYPYNFLSVSLPSGETMEYKYERFADGVNPSRPNGGICSFRAFGGISPNMVVEFYPQAYLNGNYQKNGENGFSIQEYPLLSYNVDLAKAATAQLKAMTFSAANLGGVVVDSAKAGLALAGNPAVSGISPQAELFRLNESMMTSEQVTYGLTHGLLDAASDALSRLKSIEAIKVAPNRTKGTPSSPTLLQSGMIQPIFCNKHITAEYAKIIDDYLTMYGYATNSVKTPSIYNRQSYTYIKTQDMHLKNQTMPHNIDDEITAIFNNGITFWVDPEHIGDYSVSNTPLGA